MLPDQLVECVPNFSEGRRPEVIAAIRDAVAAVEGVRVLDVHADADHNRFVLTYVVPASRAVESGLAAARAALEHIDLRAHEGAHPRMGALDVFPVRASLRHAHGALRRAGRRAWPGYGHRILAFRSILYEEAARRPDRVNLENIRKGGFETCCAACCRRTRSARPTTALVPYTRPPERSPSGHGGR